MKLNRRRKKEANIRQKKRYLHELPNTEMVKSGTIRLASGIPDNRKKKQMINNEVKKEVISAVHRNVKYKTIRLASGFLLRIPSLLKK